MSDSHFFDAPEQYHRDWRIKQAYVQQAAHYIAAQSNVTQDQAAELVKDLIRPDGEMAFINPRVKVLEKQPNGDRALKQETFDEMMAKAAQEENILSPSMVFYENRNKQRSLLSSYTATLVNRRSEIKGKQHEAKQKGDEVMENFHKQGQTSVKIAVNSISGATCSPHNAFYNPSMHTTLTSTCRITTAFANLNNERLIAGNRHYWSAEIILANLASISCKSDFEMVAKAIEMYQLVIPTVDDVMDCITRSSHLYGYNETWDARIRNYVEGLNDLERAAFVYTGDLHHLAKLNPEFWRTFLQRFIAQPTDLSLGQDWDVMKRMDGDLQSLIGILNQDIMRGKNLKDMKVEEPENYTRVVASFQNVLNLLDEYKYLIYAFWKTDNPPPTIANMPNILRRSVLGGDTDSSMATAERWVYWYSGSYKFDDTAASIAAVIVYLSSMTLVHILAQFSANMGIDNSQLYQIAMKNEFMYSSYIRTTVAKHYFSKVIACEGAVYKEADLDIKGVQLHAGKAPDEIREKITDFQVRMLDQVAEGEYIDIMEEMHTFANIEREIYNTVKKGDPSFLTTAEIKSKESYSQPYRTGYLYHEMWEEVFAPKYGPSGVLPYYGIKVNMKAPNKTVLYRGIEALEDKALAKRWMDWCLKMGKTNFTYVMVPMDIANDKGIPEEILALADTRGLIMSTLSSAYLTLESFGMYLNNSDNTRLISDFN